MDTTSKDVLITSTAVQLGSPVHGQQSVPLNFVGSRQQVIAGLDSDNMFVDLDQKSCQDDAPNINLMRVSVRSNLARGRLVALRRKVARSSQFQVRQPDANLGGHSIRDLRAMRAHIFSDMLPLVLPHSLPLRIATHSINFALILAVLPIGAASLTYSLLRGEDIAITARLTTLAGLVLVVLGGHATNLLGAI